MPNEKFYTSMKKTVFDNIFLYDYKNVDLYNTLISKILGKEIQALSTACVGNSRSSYVRQNNVVCLETTENEIVELIINPCDDINDGLSAIKHLWNGTPNTINKKYVRVNIIEGLLEDTNSFEKYTISANFDDERKEMTIYEYNIDKILNEVEKASDEYSYIAMLKSDKANLEKICAGDKFMERYKEQVCALNDDKDFVKKLKEEEKIVINVSVE